MSRTSLIRLLLSCILITGLSVSSAIAEDVNQTALTGTLIDINATSESFQNSEITSDLPDRDDPLISVNPIEIISELMTGENQGYVVEIFNEGDEDLIFNTDIEIIDEPEGRLARGPRRDQPESRFAFFQDGPAWGGDLGNLVLDQVEGLEYDLFPSNQFADFPIQDYGVLWICHSEQVDAFNAAYNNNRQRIEDWVDHGGAFYASTGTNNYGVLPVHPGGLTYTRGGTSNGTVRVSGNPDDENYNYLAELMNWEQDGTLLRGSALFHVHYEQADLDRIDNSDWNQVIVSLENADTPGILVYQYGAGYCVVGGTTDGHQHLNFANPPDWGSAGEELCYYLDHLANFQEWVSVEPVNGVLQPGQSVDMIVTIDATGLIGGEYEAEVRINSNDEEHPESVVSIFLEVTGAPDIDIQWDRDYGYPEVVDWDLAFPDLFIGNPYDVSISIVNIGTDILNVEMIDFQGEGAEYLSANPVENFEPLDPGAEIEIILTLNAEEADDYEVVMVVSSDDPDQEDYEVFLHGSPGAPPVIRVEPDAVEDDLLGAESHEHILNVENAGESDLRFEIDIEIVAEPEQDMSNRNVRNVKSNFGPFRDDPGDLIAEFPVPNGGVNMYNSGLAWDADNGYMWITEWNNPYRCVAVDPNNDFEVAAQFNAPGGCMGADYYQGTIYIINWANNFLFRFNTEGQNLGNFNVPIQPTAISINQEEGWLILEDAAGNRDLVVYDLENNMAVLGRIGNYRNFTQNTFTRSLEWVEAHPDGQLWVNTRSNAGGNNVWQITVDEDNFQATGLVQTFETFPAGSGQEWDGLGHDGENLWATSYGSNMVRIFDDGIAESKWITVDPTEGELEGGGDVDLVLTLDGTGLFGGVYEAEVQISSNDPDDPLVAVFVSLTVEPASDIFVEWPDEAGFEDENPIVDWNRFHPDIFTGEVYTIPVTIINDGTDLLIINDITANNGHFTAEPSDFEVEFDNEAVVDFIFTADDPGEWDAVMTIESNDPYKEQVEIVLHSAAFNPPIITVDPIEVEDALISGDDSEHVVNISNSGEATLRWDTNLEILEGMNNARDYRHKRNVRKTGPVADVEYSHETGIRADDPGWNLGTIAGIAQGEVEEHHANPPHRDEPSGRGILIAERCGWNNWDFEQYFRNIDGFEYDRFRTWDETRNIDFTDYDIMWIGNYETEVWVANYNRNLERVEEFVDQGGALYHTSGTNLHNTRPINPGGLVYAGNASQNECPIVLNPEDNFLINYMNENDPFDWAWGRGQRLHGNGNAHGTFLERQLDDIDNSDWYEVMAVGNPLAEPILVTYQYGQGYCFVGTILDGFLHAQPQQYQWGRTGEAVIWYLDYLSSHSRWVIWDPANGSLDPGADVDLVITLDASGLYTGIYEADLHILSNDPADPDIVISVTLDVTGFPLAEITWPVTWGYPDIAVWNQVYEELYTGGPYSLPFNFKNIGTDDLTITNVRSNLAEFTTDWDPETQSVIPPGEQTIVNVTFNAEEDDVYDAFITTTFGDGVDRIQVWVSAESFAPPILVVEPEQIQVELFTGQMREFLLNLANDGDALLRWWSDKVIIEEPGEERDQSQRNVRSTSRDIGPRRDDLGDVLGNYAWNNGGINRYKNAAYDFENGWMWLATYSPNFIQAVSFDENYENFNVEVNDFNPAGNPMDIAWLDGRLFVVPWANQFLLRYDAEGNNLGNINFAFRPCGVAASVERGLLFVQEDSPDNNRNIHVIQMNDDGEAEGQIGLINNYRAMMNNLWCRNVEWVDDHPDGQLWIHTSTRELHQFSVDTDRWQAIERVQLLQNFGGSQEYDGVAHDGTNMWHGGWDLNEFTIIDDGIAEIRWLTWTEKEGFIESGADEDVVVTINSEGLFAGDYVADLNIYSNDPDFPDDVPDVVIRIELSVVGIPNIMVLPGGDGLPPLDFERVYFGYPTSRTVTVINEGTDDLIISEVISEVNPDCYVEEADIADLVIRPGTEAPLNIWYNADPDRPGQQEARLRFMSNDENWEEGYPVEVVVSEGAMDAPVLDLEPREFRFALEEGEEEEAVLNVSNIGGSTLWFTTDIETVREPGDGRDSGLNREIRSIEQTIVPRRDLPEWITLDPSEDQIDEGGDMDIVVAINSEGLVGGDYEGAIHFLSNDPENPDQIVTILLNVTGIPSVSGDPIPFPLDGAEALEFEGVHYVDQQYPMEIEIINEGSEAFNIQDIDVSDQNNWSFNVPQMNVPARSSITAELVFEPSEVGDFEVVVMLTTDAPNVDNGEIWWEASGSALLPPIILLELPNNNESIDVSMMLDDDPIEMTINVRAEEGERDDLSFKIRTDENEEQRDRQSRSMREIEDQAGPVRDDPGDILAQIQVPFNNTSGMAFDGEMLWGCSYGQNRLIAVDLDNMEVAVNVQVHAQPFGLTFDGENLWLCQWANPVVFIFDLEGQMVEQFNLQFRQMAGMGSDREEFVYINSLDDQLVHIISIEDRQQVGTINYRAAMANADVWGIDWVPDHPDGQLWGNTRNRMYQVFVDEDRNVEAVQNFETNADQPYVGPCHDGENIWHGMWNNQTWYMRDDGVSEGLSWLTVDPTDGELEPGADTDIFLTFNPEGLEDETLYEGVIMIESNDPINPEIVIDVSLHTGEPGLWHFTNFEISDVSHSVLVTELNFDNEPVITGWEVGAFTPDGVLSGAGVWVEDRPLGMALWRNDDNGQFDAGELISYRVWDFEGNTEYAPRVEVEQGPIIFVPNALTVLSLWVSSERELTIDLAEGWNMISLNVNPVDHYQGGERRGPFIPGMFDQLIDDEDNQPVQLLKDEQGRFWSPQWNFLNIPYWDLMDGYKVKVSEDVSLTLAGSPISASSSIFMSPGWNIIAYYPTYDLDASAPDFYVLADIINDVALAKDNLGNFMSPRFNFSNMDPWTEGQGYQVKIVSEAALTHHYPEPPDEEELAEAGNLEEQNGPFPIITGSNMSLLINNITGECVTDGDLLCAYNASGILFGAGTVMTNRCGLAVWGDDASTSVVDGLADNETFELLLLDKETNTEVQLAVSTIQTGSMSYVTDEFTVVDLETKPALPENYFMSNAFPNPFNSLTRLTYGMPESGNLKIKVFDISGRLIETLVNENKQAGYHQLTWNAEKASAGVYLFEMNAGNFNSVKKVMLVK